MKGKKSFIVSEGITTLVVLFVSMFILTKYFDASLGTAFKYSIILGIISGFVSSKYLPWNHF